MKVLVPYLFELAFKFVGAEGTSAGIAAAGNPVRSFTHKTVEVAFGKVKNKVEEAEWLTSAVLVHDLELVGVFATKTTPDKDYRKKSSSWVVPKRLVKHGAAFG